MQIQVVIMGFIHRVAGLSLQDSVKSQEKDGREMQLLCVKSSHRSTLCAWLGYPLNSAIVGRQDTG